MNLYFRCQALFGKLHVSTKGTIEDNGTGFLQVPYVFSLLCLFQRDIFTFCTISRA